MERDGCAVVENGGLDNFNSHAHVERDETSSFYDGENKNFNSHAHVERDYYFRAEIGDRRISTHTLTWSVTRDACMVCNANPNFNSHAHVERDILQVV